MIKTVFSIKTFIWDKQETNNESDPRVRKLNCISIPCVAAIDVMHRTSYRTVTKSKEHKAEIN